MNINKNKPVIVVIFPLKTWTFPFRGPAGAVPALWRASCVPSFFPRWMTFDGALPNDSTTIYWDLMVIYGDLMVIYGDL